MKPALLALAVVACIILSGSSYASDKTKPGETEELITWVTHVPRNTFEGPPDAARPRSSGKPLPPAEGGMKRWDISDYLTERGVTMGPGSEAIFIQDIGAVVITNTRLQNDLADRILNWGCNLSSDVSLIEVTASLWKYDAPPANDFAPRHSHFSELRKAAGKSLHKLDSISLTTKSGNRAVVSSKSTTQDREAANQQGTTFEAEPVIGPGDETVDLQFIYRTRLSRGGSLPDLEMAHTSNISIANDKDQVVHSSALSPDTEGKPKQIALVIAMRIVRADERSVAERVEALQRARAPIHEAIIQKARAGLPSKK
jgi:hypothetical protein